jgi:uncharacterized protein
MSLLSRESEPLFQNQSFAFARILPFGLFLGFIVGEQILRTVFPVWSEQMSSYFYPARVLIVAAALAYFWSSYRELLTVRNAMSHSRIVFCICVGVAVFFVWIQLGFIFRTGGEPSNVNPIPKQAMAGELWLLFRFVGAAFIVPIIEELFWRSYLMRRIDQVDVARADPKKTSLLAMFASSAVFAMEHKELFVGLLAGLVFAWLYKQSGNLRDSILTHSVVNALLFAYVVTFEQYQWWG